MSIDLNEQIPMIPPYRVISRVQILAETKDYNHTLMNVPAMWKNTKGGGVKVAILDTGVPKHNDLQPDEKSKSFIDGYKQDLSGHSTHVGGIIAAVANNGMGVAGIAPECEDFYGAVLGGNGSGSIQAIINGIRWAVDEIGADIINMSLGVPAGYSTIKELEDACNYARDNGVAVICAAGNEAATVGQPACYDSCIAIAAVNDKKEHARFSNTGPEVDFATGGVEVYSTYLNNGYARLSGTSMASPALTGIAALILADTERKITPDELVGKLKKIAYDVGDEGFDDVFGHGIPIFRASEEPSEPDQPEEPKDDGNSPCKLGLPMVKVFVDGTVGALDEQLSLESSIGRGFRDIQKFLKRLEANHKSQ